MIEILLSISGALVAWKYAPRAGVSPALAVPAYLLFFFASAWVARRAAKYFCRTWLFALVYSLVLAPVFLRVHPENLRVDRWSALHNWLAAFFAGKFPWQSASHLGHPISGFPLLFLLAAPFYILGDVGWMQFAALAAFTALLRRRFDAPQAAYALLLLLLHPAFAFEVLCRSDLFFNMTLVAGLLFFLGPPEGETSLLRCLAQGAAWGLALSTRGVVVIPFLVWQGAALRARGPARSVASGLSAAAVAAATFLPFYLWDPSLFARFNPLSVQSGYIPSWLLAIVAALAVLAGRLDAEGRFFFRNIGLLLFGIVAACLLLSIATKGWTESMWGSFDISYFTLSFPFLLLALPARGAARPS